MLWKEGILSTLYSSQNEITVSQQIHVERVVKINTVGKKKDSKRWNEALKIKLRIPVGKIIVSAGKIKAQKGLPLSVQ